MEAQARLPLEGDGEHGKPRAVRTRRRLPDGEETMAQFEDKVLHELDGIEEYDNPMPGWLMAIWWGSLIFSAAYLIFYALSFGEGSMEAEYRGETQTALAAVQAHFDANPLVPPSAAELLAGAGNPAVAPGWPRRASPARAPRATARRRRG